MPESVSEDEYAAYVVLLTDMAPFDAAVIAAMAARTGDPLMFAHDYIAARLAG